MSPESDTHATADQAAAFEAKSAADEAEQIALAASRTQSDDEDEDREVCHCRF
jgi:hypothetical protein